MTNRQFKLLIFNHISFLWLTVSSISSRVARSRSPPAWEVVHAELIVRRNHRQHLILYNSEMTTERTKVPGRDLDEFVNIASIRYKLLNATSAWWLIFILPFAQYSTDNEAGTIVGPLRVEWNSCQMAKKAGLSVGSAYWNWRKWLLVNGWSDRVANNILLLMPLVASPSNFWVRIHWKATTMIQ